MMTWTTKPHNALSKTLLRQWLMTIASCVSVSCIFDTITIYCVNPGKYVPAISYKIHQENKKGTQPKLPLTGLAIGDGLCDPENQLAYGEFIFQIGLVDEKDRDIIKDISKVIKGYIRAKDWPKAARVN